MVRMVKEGKVTAVTGKDIDIQADSVCVHGDGEESAALRGEDPQRAERRGDPDRAA